jgi:hypothetical protein
MHDHRDDPHHRPDADPHVEWARRAAELERQCAALPEEDGDRLFAEYVRYCDLISTTPSRTAAGAREQVLLAIRGHEMGVLNDPQATGLRHAAATLERLAAAGGRA